MIKKQLDIKAIEQQLQEAENQIYDQSKEYGYISKERDVEMINQKFTSGSDEGDGEDSEIFVPHYQRGFVWSIDEQSKFIESLLLGIPIPYIFLSNESQHITDNLSRKEIIDGAQRIQTINAFLTGQLKLKGLEKLNKLNGLSFLDFSIGRRRQILNIPIRVVILGGLSEETKKDMFARINTTGNMLKHMEVRKGMIGGPLYVLFKNISQDPLFKKVCPLKPDKIKREHDIELILRFFGYSERFSSYDGNVKRFLTEYMRDKTKELNGIKEKNEEMYNQEIENMKNKYLNTLDFVDKYFPSGFRKKTTDKVVISNTFYEAISIGSFFALEQVDFDINKLSIKSIKLRLDSSDFKKIVSSDAANNKAKFEARIKFVKDKLLLI